MRDTFLARHPENRVFFYGGGNDTLGLFDVVSVDEAGESYHSALHKQMFALKVSIIALLDSFSNLQKSLAHVETCE